MYWVLVIPTTPNLGRKLKIGKSKGSTCFPTSPLLPVLATRAPHMMFSCRSLNLEQMKHIPNILGSLTGVEIVVVNRTVIMIEIAKDHIIISGQQVGSENGVNGTSYAASDWTVLLLVPIGVWL